MKILHIGLLSFFTEGMTYQENYLVEMNAKAGHDVIYVSNAGKYSDGKIVDTDEEDYVMSNGARLIRIKYDSLGIKLVTNKIQKAHKLVDILNGFSPDVIMFHGVCGYELIDVAEYVEANPSTLFYADSHEDFGNTARTFLSKVLYKYVHGYFIKKALPFINKILFIGEASRVYLKEMYKIDDSMMELFPLGGIISSLEEQEKCRKKLLNEYNLGDESIIIMHSGKLSKEKKTDELLHAIKQLDYDNAYLFIFGYIPGELENELMNQINSSDRVFFLGWKNSYEVIDLLNAADVYCQPGSPSATSQVALCCGCAEIVYPSESYKLLYEDNVLYSSDPSELQDQIKKLLDRETLTHYKEKGYSCACEKLDYVELSKRYLH